MFCTCSGFEHNYYTEMLPALFVPELHVAFEDDRDLWSSRFDLKDGVYFDTWGHMSMKVILNIMYKNETGSKVN